MADIRSTLSVYYQWLLAECSASFPGRQKRFHKNPSEKSILIVAQLLPPYVGAGVYRPTSWMRYGQEHGWKVSGLGLKLSNKIDEAGEYLKSLVPDNVHIEYAEESCLTPSWSLSPRLDGGFTTALVLYRRALEKFSDDPPGMIVATGPCFASFVAAMWIAGKFGSKLVLDYRDEWTECPFDFVSRSPMDRFWERRCLARADHVFFTTDRMQEHQLKVFPALAPEKCSVMPNGWDALASDAQDIQPQHKGQLGQNLSRFYLNFIGNLTEYVSPDRFLHDLAGVLGKRPELKKHIGLRFIGKQSPSVLEMINRFPFPESIEVKGFLPKPEASAATHNSDALLALSTRDLERYRPGKVIEYIATDRPVLVYGEAGDTSDLVTRLGAGIFVEAGNSQGLDFALSRLLDMLSTPEFSSHWSGQQRQAWVKLNSREILAQELFNRLDQLMANQPVVTDAVLVSQDGFGPAGGSVRSDALT